MKFIYKLLLICLCLNIIISVNSNFISTNSNLSNEKNNKLNSLFNKRLHSRDEDDNESSSETSEDGDDAGCQIVQAYWAPPEPVKRKKYNPRWPEKPKFPKKQVPWPHVTCDPENGELLLKELKQFFPPINIKPKVSSSKAKKNKKHGKYRQSSVTITRTFSVSIASPVKPPGRWTGKLWTLAKQFKDKLSADSTRRRLALRRRPRRPINKNKNKRRPTIRISQKEKRRRLRRRRNLQKLEEIAALNRQFCYRRLRTFFEDGFRNPYKGVKWFMMGRALKKCFEYKK